MKVVKVNQKQNDPWEGKYYHSLVPGSSSQPKDDSNWSAVQAERKEKSATIQFFIIECGCGTRTMVEFEYVEYKPSDGLPGKPLEVAEVACPGCNHKEEFNTFSDPDGVKVRILESWHEDGPEPQGIESADLERKNAELSETVENLIREREELLRHLREPELQIKRIAMSPVEVRVEPDFMSNSEKVYAVTSVAAMEFYERAMRYAMTQATKVPKPKTKGPKKP